MESRKCGTRRSAWSAYRPLSFTFYCPLFLLSTFYCQPRSRRQRHGLTHVVVSGNQRLQGISSARYHVSR